MSNLTVCKHPLLSHYLAMMRRVDSMPELFRHAQHHVVSIILQEATKSLAVCPSRVTTPIDEAQVELLDPKKPIVVVPILRAGLMMSEVFLNLTPSASVYHVGLSRNEDTFLTEKYFNKLNSNVDLTNAQIFIVDPMLATGNTAKTAVNLLRQLNVSEHQITFTCVIASPEGLKNLQHTHPNIKIVTGVIDLGLNEKAYIIPGMGDAGDRYFATL